ncbi:MAG: hypothetical protein ACYSTL_02640 [Planctomycetota bacterium]|jgi:hypothetical protein
MSPEDEEFVHSGEEYADFVPVVVVHSPEEAEEYRELLSDHDIPAVVDDGESVSGNETRAGQKRTVSRGVSVLVPEVLLDEASEIIADREDLDEFRVDDEDDEDEDEEFDLEEAPDSEPRTELDDEEDLFFEADEEEL